MTSSPATLAATAQKAIAIGDWPAAVAAFRALLAAIPNAPASLHYNLGLALKHAGDPLQSLASLEQALLREPSHQGALFEHGVVLLDLGRWNAALLAFETYLQRHPNDLDALRNKARLLTALGQWTAAEAAWRRLPATDGEALLGRLSAALERGDDAASALMREAAANKDTRPLALKQVTHAARASIPASAALWRSLGH